MNKQKRVRQEKGITLVALIITIIVLLILAVVSINAVQNDGIINYAKNARTEYEKAQEKEQGLLEYYESLMGGTVGKWKQEGATITKINEDKTKTVLKIGDYVNYNEGSSTHTPDTSKGAGTSKTGGSNTAGYTLGTSELATEDLKWRVLGVNAKGQLELISADPTKQTLYLANDEGYVNAETTYNEDGSVKELGTLDKYCNDLYGQGTDAEGNKLATGARSLNVDDINKLTKYDPKSSTSYGVEWQYRFSDASTYVQYSKDGGTTWADTGKTTFRLPDEETAISSYNKDIRKVEYTYYYYNIASNLTADDGFTADEATAISNMICKGTTSSNISQWLASRCVVCSSSTAYFRVRGVNNGSVHYYNFFASYGYFNYGNYRVRPVVSLKSDISLSGSGDSVGTVDNMWQIS